MDDESSRFTLYCFSSAKALPLVEGDNYSPLLEYLRRLDIFGFSPPINMIVDVPILVTEDNRAGHHRVRKIPLLSINLDVSG